MIKRVFPFLLICLISSFDGLAQARADFIVNKGEVVTQVIPVEEQYRLPAFEEGKVYFRNNTFIRARLNYNLLYGEIQYINHKADTLALIGDYKLKFITVGKYVYFYAHKIGYLEVVSSYPQVKLARKQHLKISKSEVELTSRSSPGIPASKSNGYSSGGSGVRGKDWKFRELYTQQSPGDLYLTKKATYFIIDKNERVYEANKSTILKLFPKHKKAIDTYIKKYKPDFNHRNDLQGLFAYCSQLDEK